MNKKYEVGDMVQINIELHDKAYLDYVGDFVEGRWYEVRIVYQSGCLCVMSERGNSTCIEGYMVSSHKTRQQFLEDQKKEQMTELKIGMKFKAKPTIVGETWSRGTVCGKEYEIHGVTLATERFSYKDSAGAKVYMPFEDFDKYFELVDEDAVQNSEWKVGDFCLIDMVDFVKKCPSCSQLYKKDKLYTIATVYPGHGVNVYCELGHSSYVPNSSLVRPTSEVIEEFLSHSEYQIGCEFIIDHSFGDVYDQGKVYKVLMVSANAIQFFDNNDYPRWIEVSRCKLKNCQLKGDILEGEYEKGMCNSGEVWKVGDKFKFKNRYTLLSDCSLEESFEVYGASEHMIKFRDSNGVARFLLDSELENRIEKIQEEEEIVKMENTDKEYKIGDKVFIDIEKFGREWSITASRLSPDVPYEIFAYGNPKDPESYYSRASDGYRFYFLGEHVDKAKTATLNKEQETEESTTNEEEVTREIQQKLEYMGLSFPAIQDIMQMVNNACTESYQNGIAVGKKGMKMDLEKFIGGK